MALGAATGCQAPPAAKGPTECMITVSDHWAYLDDAIALLRLNDFPPDRVDRPGGLIVSQPVTSGQWFEFWRKDVRGGYQLLESSINTVRRRVTVELQPTEEVAEPPEGPTPNVPYRLRVLVEKERLSIPARQITTASGALALYSDEVPTTEGAVGPLSRVEDWQPLGRDPLLEMDLLGKLAALPEARRVE